MVSRKTLLTLAVSTSLAGGMVATAQANTADENFLIAAAGILGVTADSPNTKAKEGKCGEGKCGAKKASKEAKCGEGKCGGKKATKEAKCGGDKAKEGKCGEGKCGSK